MKSNFQRLWIAFPDHIRFPTLADLYSWLGGAAAKNIDAPGFGANGNTCASRLSVAFNRGGAPITAAAAAAAGARTVGTADGSRIIYQVAGFRNYLVRTLGRPTIDQTSPYDDAFRGRKGTVAFSVNWAGASGHIALWDGTTYREPTHDNYSAYVSSEDQRVRTSLGEFWELP